MVAIYSVISKARVMRFGIGACLQGPLPGRTPAAAGRFFSLGGRVCRHSLCCRCSVCQPQAAAPTPAAACWGFVFPMGVFSATATRLWNHLPGLAAMRVVAAVLMCVPWLRLGAGQGDCCPPVC